MINMFLHFYFVNIKKEKKSYILLYKTENNIISFNDINSILYDKLNNSQNSNNINYHELFYIKQGISIPFTNEVWNQLIKIYLKKIELLYLIDDKYIKTIYSYNTILYLIDNYKNEIKQFLIDYYTKTTLE